MLYVYSTPWGDRRAISREPVPHLVVDLVRTFEDEDESLAWQLLHSLQPARERVETTGVGRRGRLPTGGLWQPELRFLDQAPLLKHRVHV